MVITTDHIAYHKKFPFPSNKLTTSLSVYYLGYKHIFVAFLDISSYA
jgi:hypothetical protein